MSIEIGPGFALGADGRALGASPPDADWAVLTIDVTLGTADRLLPMERGLPAAGLAAMLGGYQQDRAQVIVADVACSIAGVVRVAGVVMLRHGCAGTRGVSGAPVFTRETDGRWGVAGVATVSRVGVSGGDAVPIATIAARSGLLRAAGLAGPE